MGGAVVGDGRAEPMGEVMVKSRSNNPLEDALAAVIPAGLIIVGRGRRFVDPDDAEVEEGKRGNDGGPERRSVDREAGAVESDDGFREGGRIEAAAGVGAADPYIARIGSFRWAAQVRADQRTVLSKASGSGTVPSIAHLLLSYFDLMNDSILCSGGE